MLLITWVRYDNGGFTAWPETAHRTLLMDVLAKHLAAAMRRVYCHKQTAVFLYEALAARAADMTERDIFLALAEAEKRRLTRVRRILQRVDANIPCEDRTMWGSFWRRFLLRCGRGVVLAYIQHVMRCDLRDQARLLNMIRSITSAYRKELL